jgi:hypothetical protein
LILGLWLTAAPAALGVSGLGAHVDHIVGPLAASVGLMARWAFMRSTLWATLFLGLGMAATGVFTHDGAGAANHVLCGLLLAVFSSWQGRRHPERYGGGWAALWKPGQKERPSAGDAA